LGITALLAVFALMISRVIPEGLMFLGLALILIWTGVIVITAIRGRERARTAVILSLVSVLLMVVHIFIFNLGNSTAGFLRYIDSSAEQTTATTPVDEALNMPFVIYISGKDAGGALSDVNQLAVVNPKLHRILLVNTPRDYYVQLAGKSGLPDKLTHAGSYGLNTSIETLKNLYGVEINYYLQINFDSLVKLVDVLGGIEVDSAYAFDDFSVGRNYLNGERALRFARNRSAFAGGDRVRGENQQRVITGILRKLSDPGVAMNYLNILGALEGSFTTNFGSENIAAYARQQIGSNPNWSISNIAVDGVGAMKPTYSYPRQNLYVMVPDQGSVAETKRQIVELINL
jgi:LCP family protein required for cell wall assembly